MSILRPAINSAATAQLQELRTLLRTVPQGRTQLAIAEDCQGGILIRKAFYNDFIGPGAAIVCRLDLKGTLQTVGEVKFQPLQTSAERQQALLRRVAYLRTLANIARSPVPLRRSCQIVEQLCQWVPEAAARSLPAEAIADLVGVTPTAVKLAWRSQEFHQRPCTAWETFPLRTPHLVAPGTSL